MELIDVIKNNQWAVAEGKHNDLPLTVRFRNDLMEKPDISGHPNLVRLHGEYEGLEDGLPGNLVKEQMSLFEDRLRTSVEQDASAILVAVITNDGRRDWVFYARDVQEFLGRLMGLQQQDQAYPVELTSRGDPQWEYLYQEILAGIHGGYI